MAEQARRGGVACLYRRIQRPHPEAAAEFEADLARTREGMAIAKAKGRLRGKKPKLSPHQEAPRRAACTARGRNTTTELAELFNVARSTVYRAIRRAGIGQSDAAP